jgi:hypothetical protein
MLALRMSPSADGAQSVEGRAADSGGEVAVRAATYDHALERRQAEASGDFARQLEQRGAGGDRQGAAGSGRR